MIIKRFIWMGVVFGFLFLEQTSQAQSRDQRVTPATNTIETSSGFGGVECRETRGGTECHPIPLGVRREGSTSNKQISKSPFSESKNLSQSGDALKGFFSFKLLTDGDLLLLVYNDIKKEYLDVGDILVVEGDLHAMFPKYLADAIKAAAPAGSRSQNLYIFSRGGAEAMMRDRLQKEFDPLLGLCDGGTIEVTSGISKSNQQREPSRGGLMDTIINRERAARNSGIERGEVVSSSDRSGSSGSASSSDSRSGRGGFGFGNQFGNGEDRGGNRFVGDSFADRFGSSSIELPGLIISGPCGDGRGDGVGGSCRQAPVLPSGGGQPNWMASFFKKPRGMAMADNETARRIMSENRPQSNPDSLLRGRNEPSARPDNRPPSDPNLARRTEADLRRAVERARANPERNPTTARFADRLEDIANKIADGRVRTYVDDLGGPGGMTGPDKMYVDPDFRGDPATRLHEAGHLAGADEKEARDIAREATGSPGGGDKNFTSRRDIKLPADPYDVDCPLSGCPSLLAAFPIALPDVDWTEELALQITELSGPGGTDVVDCFGESECGSVVSRGSIELPPFVRLTWDMILYDPLGPYVNPGSEFSEGASRTTGEGGSATANRDACQAPFTIVTPNFYTIDCMDPTQESCHSEVGNERAMQNLRRNLSKPTRNSKAWTKL